MIPKIKNKWPQDFNEARLLLTEVVQGYNEIADFCNSLPQTESPQGEETKAKSYYCENKHELYNYPCPKCIEVPQEKLDFDSLIESYEYYVMLCNSAGATDLDKKRKKELIDKLRQHLK
jgi:hypothetical protein